MSFPTISFKHTNIDSDAHLQELIENKFQSLAKYIGEETDVRCEVEFEKITQSQNGNIFRVETNLWLKGTLHRAEATLDSFEKAIDEVRNELDKEVRRAGSKRESLYRRGRRKIKDMMRFGQ